MRAHALEELKFPPADPSDGGGDALSWLAAAGVVACRRRPIPCFSALPSIHPVHPLLPPYLPSELPFNPIIPRPAFLRFHNPFLHPLFVREPNLSPWFWREGPGTSGGESSPARCPFI